MSDQTQAWHLCPYTWAGLPFPETSDDRYRPIDACAVTPGLRVRTASGLVGRVGSWMDPRGGIVGVTTDDGEFVMANETQLRAA